MYKGPLDTTPGASSQEHPPGAKPNKNPHYCGWTTQKSPTPPQKPQTPDNLNHPTTAPSKTQSLKPRSCKSQVPTPSSTIETTALTKRAGCTVTTPCQRVMKSCTWQRRKFCGYALEGSGCICSVLLLEAQGLKGLIFKGHFNFQLALWSRFMKLRGLSLTTKPLNPETLNRRQLSVR